MMKLRSNSRRYLMKNAHELNPVVMIGRSGLSEGVIQSTIDALDDHELIKVRFQEYKEAKQDIAHKLAEQTDSTVVQIIGNVAVLYRMHPDPDKRRIMLPE